MSTRPKTDTPAAPIVTPPLPPLPQGADARSPGAHARSASVHAHFDPASSREALIATAAYYRAEQRGFQPGHETEDWLAAEREIDGAGTFPDH